ncbi:MAG TPA: hypothetical protein VMM58_07470 [Bacteroidota bacterium]|nr:hypothetical protein [Bacteroidota bacterium]
MGRSAIFLAIGFTIVCLLSGMNLSRVSVDAFKNAITYQESTAGHNIVQADVNFACNQLFLTPNWRAGYSNVPFGGGTFSAAINTVVNGKDSSRIQIVATALYQGTTYTIKVLLQPSLFSKFAYFSDNEPSTINWVTGDTVWGPYHSNTKLYVSGNPVFNGKTTNFGGLVKAHSSDKPQFNGGYETGVSITMPSDLNTLKGKAQQAGGGFYLSTTNDFYLNFNADGTVTYRNGTSGSWTTTSLSTFAGTNQVVVIDGGNLRIKGKLNGQVTIAALSSSTSRGIVYLDSSIAYNSNPLAGASTDMMGIVATNNVLITDNTNNNTPAGITVQAAIFSLKGGFGAQNYDTRTDVGGQIHLLGGISQAVRQAVGTSGSPGTGFHKSYYYDNRMLVTSPPAFPTTGAYEVLEWLE